MAKALTKQLLGLIKAKPMVHMLPKTSSCANTQLVPQLVPQVPFLLPCQMVAY